MRRNDTLQFTPAEKAIYDALGEVEKLAADTRLTKAVMLLQDARNLVADFIEDVNPIDPSAPQSLWQEEFQGAIANKDYSKATTMLNKTWLQDQIQLARLNDPTLKELIYLKTPVDTGDGKYLLLFIHVDGKKLQL